MKSGSSNGGGRPDPIRTKQQGLKVAVETSWAAKGGRLDGGRCGRNRIAAQGCRGQQGPGEQVESGNTLSAGTGGGGWRE